MWIKKITLCYLAALSACSTCLGRTLIRRSDGAELSAEPVRRSVVDSGRRVAATRALALAEVAIATIRAGFHPRLVWIVFWNKFQPERQCAERLGMPLWSCR